MAAKGISVALRDVALVAGIAWLTAGPSAQGLAGVARRSSARPATAVRTYTNADVEPARPVPPATPEAPDTVGSEKVGTGKETKEPAAVDAAATAAGSAPRPLTPEEEALQEAWAEQGRRDADALRLQVQKAQQLVQAVTKEFQNVQRAHAAGDPAATLEARDTVRQSLTHAERELASAQRALAKAETRAKAN